MLRLQYGPRRAFWCGEDVSNPDAGFALRPELRCLAWVGTPVLDAAHCVQVPDMVRAAEDLPPFQDSGMGWSGTLRPIEPDAPALWPLKLLESISLSES
jgi:hypothetical protein